MKNELTYEFETIDDLINRFNENIRSNRQYLNGRIFSIECAKYECTNLDWNIDTEKTFTMLSTKYLFILRIYYFSNDNSHDSNFDRLRYSIGIKDFQPKQLIKPTFFRRPKYECFNDVIERGCKWLRQSNAEGYCFKFLNAKSIDVKIVHNSALANSNNNDDESYTRLMAFTEHGAYIRIFRLFYLDFSPNINDQCQSLLPLISINLLGSRLFTSTKRTDTIDDVVQRLHDWIDQFIEKSRLKQLKHHHQHHQSLDLSVSDLIISAETCEIFIKDLPTNHNRWDIERIANDQTFIVNRFGNKNAYSFYSFRVYYDQQITSNHLSYDSMTNITSLSVRSMSLQHDDHDDSSWSIDDSKDMTNTDCKSLISSKSTKTSSSSIADIQSIITEFDKI